MKRTHPNHPTPLYLARLVISTVFMWGCTLGLYSAQAQEGFLGSWSGAVEIPGAPLEVLVTLADSAGVLGGTIDIPAQGARGLPLENVRVEGNAVSFAIGGVPGAPTFGGTLEAETLSGTFSQSGQTFPFSLARVDIPAANTSTAPEATEGGEAVAPAPPEADEEIYEDPQGRFSVPIPTNWTATEGEGFVTLSGPEGDLRVWVLAVSIAPGDDLEAAIQRAWQQVDPAFDLEPTGVLTPPPAPGVEQTVVTNYEAGQRVYQGLAQRYEGTAYVLLVGGDLGAVQRRGAQVNIIATGLEIAALEQTDLTDVTPQPVDGPLTKQLETFIGAALPEFGIPGAAVAVVQGGEVVYTGGFGVREAGGNAPLTPDTPMMIGSTGKSLTTLLMATLVDEGAIAWDTPAAEVLPEFTVADPELTKSITLENLVCACTGVPRRDLELLFNADELTAEGVVESLRTFEFFTAFGEAFQYSNQLVGTGGYAAAAANGADFGALFEGYARSLQARVLDPIGMTNTTLSFEAVEATGAAATPHTATMGGLYEPIPLALERLLLPIAPAGSHWSTARDMARYLQTALALGVAPGGARVVSERNLRATWAPQVPVTATVNYGLGWFVEDYRGLTLIYHGGNTLGFTSDLAFLPEQGLGVVVLTNGQGTNAFNEAVRERLFELVFDQPARAEANLTFVLEQTERFLAEGRDKLRTVEAAAVGPFLGRYRNDALGEVRLSFAGDALTLDVGEFASELRPVVDGAGEPDGYIFFGAPLAGLPVRLQQAAGAPTLVIGEGAVAYTFERLE